MPHHALKKRQWRLGGATTTIKRDGDSFLVSRNGAVVGRVIPVCDLFAAHHFVGDGRKVHVLKGLKDSLFEATAAIAAAHDYAKSVVA